MPDAFVKCTYREAHTGAPYRSHPLSWVNMLQAQGLQALGQGDRGRARWAYRGQHRQDCQIPTDTDSDPLLG